MAAGGLAQDRLTQLVELFHSQLDEALIVAITSDYDLGNSTGYEAAKSTLHSLAQGVPSEEATGFNPSGIALETDDPHDGAADQVSASATSVSQSHLASPRATSSHRTDASSTDGSVSTTEPATALPSLAAFSDVSEENKVALLQTMFADLKRHEIEFSLKRAKGDLQVALDDLLNIEFLKSTGQQLKGVDGFFHPDETPAKRGKKGKKRAGPRLNTGVARATEVVSPGPLSPKDLESITELAELLDLHTEVVSGVFEKAGCSKGDAAIELLNQYMKLGIQATNAEDKKRAAQLAQKYRNVPEEYMATIVQVTDSASQNSDHLAALLSRHLNKHPQTQRLDLDYRLTPLPQAELEGLGSDMSSAFSRLRVGASGSTTPVSHVSSGSLTLSEALQKSAQHNQARRDAMESASEMHRRGGSNPLYRQAAVVYTDRARDHRAFAQQATSSAAETLVSRQRTASSIDLHGVSVADGVRIARRDVGIWWNGLGEFRSRRAKEQGFTVVTGLGRHSAGGVSQMRKAVAVALLQDGWKVQAETGRFVVTGRQ